MKKHLKSKKLGRVKPAVKATRARVKKPAKKSLGKKFSTKSVSSKKSTRRTSVRTRRPSTHSPTRSSIRSQTNSPAHYHGKALTLSSESHLSISKPKVIAPTEKEKLLAIKTLSMIHQNGELSGDDSRVFQSFLERFHADSMEKEDLYTFLRDNPSIRRKIWDSSIFE
ncbi:MAG: hypothetical protein WCT31_02685 [Candidatus Micrarchaeia archaeon]|jgi:hypothetical protein